MMIQTKRISGRRGFLASVLVGMMAGWFGKKANAEAAATSSVAKSGEPVMTRMRRGNPPVQPLDSMMVFEREDENNGKAMTHEVLSLIHQEKGKNSYPWTLYASLDTAHETGDGCVVCSRLHKNGPGWSSGLHSEVFNHGRAVALGVNVEMSSDFAGPEATEVIGVNIQAVAGPRPMQCGIQIHDGLGKFETGLAMRGAHHTAIDVKGKSGLGVNLHDNAIQLNEGACVILDGKGLIRVRYKGERIEFLNGDKCFGHLDVNGADHAL